MPVAMSDNEMRCFEVAMRWQRRDLRQALLRSLLPIFPFVGLFHSGASVFKFIYIVVMLLVLPLLVVFWLLRALMLMIVFPYSYIQAYFKPGKLKGPGERNLQGVHNAFSRYLHMSAESYIHCFNDWVAILYGEAIANENRIESYVRFNRMHQSVFGNADVPDARMRNALSMARESISRKLGYY
ncbi:hypothetical protein SAMN02745866_04039 [Alteromonadaceae bacterium Bs31]|nr:hypothetical protein SAMN02745866_04039 [Alteromonadaceae bacterium Bs31]